MKSIRAGSLTMFSGALLLAAQSSFPQGSLGLTPVQGAAAFRQEVGRRLTFICPASDGAKATVYGTETYTDDSAICAAAIHSGVLKPGQAGVVSIVMGSGAKSFRGSEKNGVTTRSYEAWPYSYTFALDDKPGTIAWSTVWNQVPAGFTDSVAVNCPTDGKIDGVIWGTDVYTSDSAICVASVHRGLITAEEGGTVSAKRAPGAKEFPGSFQNGIESKRWGALEDAFIVAAAGSAQPPPVPPPPPPPPPPPEEPPPANVSVHPRTIVLAGFAGTGPAPQAGPILPRTVALTGFTGVGPAPDSGPMSPRIIHTPGWTGVGPAP